MRVRCWPGHDRQSPGMKTSPAGRALIEAFEGLYLSTYDDGEGVLTIGYGHTSAAGAPAVSRGMKITPSMADEILRADLADVEKSVAKAIRVPLTQSEFDALVSFEFNTGDLVKSSIDDKINSGRKPDAMETLLLYVHGANSGQIYAGLVRRRKAEKLLFEGDVATALKVAGVQAAIAETTPKNVSKPPIPPPPPAPTPRAGFWAKLASIFTRKA